MKNYLQKIVSRTELLQQVERLKREGKTVVFTNGCFDLFHAGHVRLLQQARNQGDVLIVGLNSDASVTQNKGSGRPIHSVKDRAELLAALQSVDYVVVFEEASVWELVSQVKPDILVKGGDWGAEIVGREIIEADGGKVVSIAVSEGLSTTNIIRKIQQLKS